MYKKNFQILFVKTNYLIVVTKVQVGDRNICSGYAHTASPPTVPHPLHKSKAASNTGSFDNTQQLTLQAFHPTSVPMMLTRCTTNSKQLLDYVRPLELRAKQRGKLDENDRTLMAAQKSFTEALLQNLLQHPLLSLQLSGTLIHTENKKAQKRVQMEIGGNIVNNPAQIA